MEYIGILEQWNNNEVTPSLSKPHELSYRSTTYIRKRAIVNYKFYSAYYEVASIDVFSFAN